MAGLGAAGSGGGDGGGDGHGLGALGLFLVEEVLKLKWE